jgi:hypothetical protein
MKLSHLLSEESHGGIRVGSIIHVGGLHLTVKDTRMGKGEFGNRVGATPQMEEPQVEDCLLVLLFLAETAEAAYASGGFISAFRMQEGIGGRLSLDLTKIWSGVNPYNGSILPSNLIGRFWMGSDVVEIL